MSDALTDGKRSSAVAWVEHPLTRRSLLRAGGVLALGGGVLLGGSGCSPPAPSCFDPELFSTPERALRETQEYTDPSPHGEARSCDGCQFFTPQGDAGCGRCQILAGPVGARAHCKAWARAEGRVSQAGGRG